MASAGLSRPTSQPTPDSLPSQNPSPNSSSPDESATFLRTRLEKLAARRNARSMQHEVARAVTVGALLCAPLLLSHHFLIIDLATEIPVAIMLLAFGVGMIRGWLKRVGTFEVALDADRVLGLDERLSSALAFAQPEEWKLARSRSAHKSATSSTRFGIRKLAFRKSTPRKTSAYVSAPSSTNLVPALVNDAAARVRQLEPKKVYPAKFDLTAKLLIVSLAALLTFAIMPDLPVFRTLEQQKFATAMQKQGNELDQIAKPILKQPQLDERSPSKKLAGKLEALARKMQRGRMGKEEALLGIGQLRHDIEKATKPDANNQQPESSDVQRLREALQSQPMQSAEGQKMQQSLQNNDIKKAADQLDKLADKMDKGQMTPEEKKQTAQDLKKAAEALRQNGQSDAAKKLEDAAKSLEKQAQQQQNGKQDGQNAGKNGQQQGQQKQGSPQKSGQQSQKNGSQQNGKNGSQQSQQGQQNKGGKQGQSQSGQSGQQGQNKGQKSGSSTQSGGQGQQSGQQNGSQQGGSQALRDMANQMRQGNGSGGQGNNSQNLQNMLNKIKEAERNAGGNSGQGQGGNGSSQGENAGQSVTPGKDLQPSDPHGAVGGGGGLGPRNHAGGSAGGGGVSKLKSKRTGDTRRWQDVWTDRLPKTHQKIDRITGKLGDSGEMQQLPTKTEAKGGTARTPYYNVYESYKKDAEDAVAKDNVPPAYKQPVKNYFESLKP